MTNQWDLKARQSSWNHKGKLSIAILDWLKIDRPYLEKLVRIVVKKLANKVLPFLVYFKNGPCQYLSFQFSFSDEVCIVNGDT